jgi:hypothetical protein
MERKRVGILIFPDVEVLDFCGPFEVFSVTRLNEERRREAPSPFEVILIAEQDPVIQAAGGLRVIPAILWMIAQASTFSLFREVGEHASR